MNASTSMSHTPSMFSRGASPAQYKGRKLFLFSKASSYSILDVALNS